MENSEEITAGPGRPLGLERHLEGLPFHARPLTLRYRISKLTARHKGKLATAAAGRCDVSSTSTMPGANPIALPTIER